MKNFIIALEEKQIHLRLVEGKLHVSAPKAVLSSPLVAELKERKEEVVQFLERMQDGQGQSQIPLLENAADYEVSHAQKRLWLLDKMGAKSAYNVPLIYHFEGLDTTLFTAAVEKLVHRHEVLRSRFVEVGGNPRQEVVAVEALDFSIPTSEMPESLAFEYLKTQAARPFDLTTAPLIRVELVKVAENRDYCLICLHHIITDGWSVNLLLNELALLYNGLKNGQAVKLPALKFHYKDFAAWQNQQLDKGVFAQDRAFWETTFKEQPIALDLPFYKQRPKMKTYKGATQKFLIGQPLGNTLNKLASKYGLSRFMLALATLKTLIFKYTGVEDITLGSVFADRLRSDLQNQQGFFVNTLAIRTKFSKKDSFAELMAQVKQCALASYKHQAYPFDLLVDQLDIQRNSGRSPLFDILVLFEDENQGEQLSLEAVQVKESTILEEETSKYDLTFTFIQSARGMELKIVYNKDLIECHWVERMFSHYQSLLLSIQENENTPIKALNFLPESERIQILSEFNNTTTYFPEKTIHQLFENQVKDSPQRIALAFKGQKTSYQELNEKANQLAHYLINECQVKPGNSIGIQVKRSEKMMVALMATLKAGAAYVPIATNTPENRVAYIQQDAEIKVLLTDEKLAAINETIASYPKHNPELETSNEDLMYIIYTSGSTGQPKGVMVAHRGVVNRVYWMWKHYGFHEKSAILQKTSFTFDVSVGEIFTALCFGARLVLCPEEKVYDPQGLVDEIEQNQVSTVHFVPSMFNVFLDAYQEGWDKRMSSVAHVFASGEALLPETVKKYYSKFSAPVHNLYGPTEASIEVTHYTAEANDTCIPIGAPISNVRMYVLGTKDELVPIGAWGEICIAGVGLAIGYKNRAKLTQERFAANPFESGKKLYRTGDIGRWLPDGKIEYMGRKDFQVKIRGFRIELGEIENALLGCAGVESAVAVVHGEGAAKKIVAYYTGIQTDALQAYLKKQLPEYMVPAQFIHLEAIPLSNSGKVNRKALPLPPDLSQEEEYQAAANETEEQLVEIWKLLLGVEKPSTSANFFTLGGHSLLAIQMITRVHKAFNLKLELQEILEYPTIQELAAHIQRVLRIRMAQMEEKVKPARQLII